MGDSLNRHFFRDRRGPFGLISSSTPRGEAMCPARIACHYHPAWRRPARQLREMKMPQFRLSPSCHPCFWQLGRATLYDKEMIRNAVNLLRLDSEKRFEQLCQALLHAEFQLLHSFSAPDLGMDAYHQETGTIFQAYFPERSPRRDKIGADLAKAREQASVCRRWVLMIPKNPTPALQRWLCVKQQALCPFDIEIWGETRILELLRKHPAIKEEYFPSEWKQELRKLAKGKGPRAGDAAPGQEMSAEQCLELRDWITKLAEAEAKRKRRAPRPTDYSREHIEFQSHYNVSTYSRLPAPQFFEAREYLEKKYHARRSGEPPSQKRNRFVNAIKAIQRKLGMGDQTYRRLLVDLTGKTSTTLMGLDELAKTFKHLKQLQGLSESDLD